MTNQEKRMKAEARKGWAMVALALFSFTTLLGGAAYADAQSGVSVDSSLSQQGL